MPLDIARLSAPPLPPSRYLQSDTEGTIVLIEVADGEPIVIGPVVVPTDVEREARTLLAATGPGSYLPPVVHRLCVAFLAGRGVEVMS
jgi:hypothetical protein